MRDISITDKAIHSRWGLGVTFRFRHAHSRARARSSTVASKVSATLRIGILYYTLCSLMLPY